MECFSGSFIMGFTWKSTMLKRSCISTLYICVYLNFGVVLDSCLSLLISCYVLTLQMTHYCGFVNGADIRTLNLASATWVLYSQAHNLISSGKACLGPATNNIIEYHAVIGLLTEASSRYVDHMVVYLDSWLVVSQLNHVYTIHNPILFLLF